MKKERLERAREIHKGNCIVCGRKCSAETCSTKCHFINNIMKDISLSPLSISVIKHSAKSNSTNGIIARKKLKVLERDNYRCTNCGKCSDLTIAHTIPMRELKRRNKRRTIRASDYNLNKCKVSCTRCHIYEDFCHYWGMKNE